MIAPTFVPSDLGPFLIAKLSISRNNDYFCFHETFKIYHLRCGVDAAGRDHGIFTNEKRPSRLFLRQGDGAGQDRDRSDAVPGIRKAPKGRHLARRLQHQQLRVQGYPRHPCPERVQAFLHQPLRETRIEVELGRKQLQAPCRLPPESEGCRAPDSQRGFPPVRSASGIYPPQRDGRTSYAEGLPGAQDARQKALQPLSEGLQAEGI